MPLMSKTVQPIRMRQANRTICGFHTRLAATNSVNTSHKSIALPRHKMSGFTTKATVDYFFTKIGENSFKCRCGSSRKQDIKKGYVNLMSHVRQCHSNYKQEIQDHKTSGTINSMFGTVTQKAKNLHGWIDLIVTGGYPFSMVDKPVTSC